MNKFDIFFYTLQSDRQARKPLKMKLKILFIIYLYIFLHYIKGLPQFPF